MRLASARLASVRLCVTALLGVFASTTLPSPSVGQQVPIETPVCLALRLLDSDGAPPRWGRVHFPPDTIALDSVVVRHRGKDGFLIRPEPPNLRDAEQGRSLARRGVWRIDGDSLRLVWNNPFAGVHIRGVLRDSVFSGIATSISDVRTSAPDRPVQATGRRITCPAGIMQRIP